MVKVIPALAGALAIAMMGPGSVTMPALVGLTTDESRLAQVILAAPTFLLEGMHAICVFGISTAVAHNYHHLPNCHATLSFADCAYDSFHCKNT